jgi:D-alanyl-D-alanine carboxypeptidase
MPLYFADQATRAFLRRNSKYKVRDLMRALLVPSGCDAAYCLAVNIGKLYDDKNPETAFVRKMN